MKIYLKKGREKSVLNRHQWLFSGAILRVEDPDPGSVAAVCSHDGSILAYGYYNPASNITVRILTFGAIPFSLDTLRASIRGAIERRRLNPMIDGSSAMRLVHSEGDSIPGLIADYYSGHIAVQSLTMGMDNLLSAAAAILQEEAGAESVYERSDHAGRAAEGLIERSGQLIGETPDKIQIDEGGLKFSVNVKSGQKTGFFIDQRDSRALVKTISSGRRVLNLFSYTGGFTAAALAGGARHVTSVDSSADALRTLDENLALNNFTHGYDSIRCDAFEFVRSEEIDHELVIIDPPAFAKNRGAVERALAGYNDINFQVLRKIPSGSMVLTFSCSRFIDIGLFQKVIFSAARDAGRNGYIIRKGWHPADHPLNLYHPEGEYLKSILLFVE